MKGVRTGRITESVVGMDISQTKVSWHGTVVSIQPRSTVWRYLIDNRTHRECGFNIFLKGSIDADEDVICESQNSYDFCIAISDKQQQKLEIGIGDELQGTAWTKLYPETEFADFYRAGSLKKIKADDKQIKPEVFLDEKHAASDGTPIPRVFSDKYPGPVWKMLPPPLEVYAYRGARMLSKSCWKGKCFQCVWANMANVTVEYNFDTNNVKHRFETFCYGPQDCKYYKMGPARAVPYYNMKGIKDQGWLDEICVEYRTKPEE